MTARAVDMIANLTRKGAKRAHPEQITLPYSLIRRNSDAVPSLATSYGNQDKNE